MLQDLLVFVLFNLRKFLTAWAACVDIKNVVKHLFYLEKFIIVPRIPLLRVSEYGWLVMSTTQARSLRQSLEKFFSPHGDSENV